MLVKRLYGKFQNDECVMLYESSPDVALLDSFFSMLGGEVVQLGAICGELSNIKTHSSSGTFHTAASQASVQGGRIVHLRLL